MLEKISLLIFLLLANHWGEGPPPAAIYEAVTDFTAAHHLGLWLGALLGGGGLLAMAHLFTCCGLYRVVKAAAVLLENGVLLLLLALGLGQALFYVILELNFYHATGYQPLVQLFILLGAAIQAQRIIDFNHPWRHSLIPALVAVTWPLPFMVLYNLLG